MFAKVDRCWVCGGRSLRRFHECRFDFREYATQDPGLHAYTGLTVWLVRCRQCGFGQPEEMPTLPGFFDRMYDQRWSADWIEREFEADYKDFIFRALLRDLDRLRGRAAGTADRGRSLLDVGAHAGRFMHLAAQEGWTVEGIELNPRTAACAARRTGAPVHQVNAHALSANGRRYAAVTLIDVLEHIPEPAPLLANLAALLAPAGWIAVKVPSGPGQWLKERTLAAVLPGRDVSLAGNLVHVNHFSPRSLKLALERAGFRRVDVCTAPPELPPGRGVGHRLSVGARLAIYAAARLPQAVHSPLALNLLAYAQVPS